MTGTDRRAQTSYTGAAEIRWTRVVSTRHTATLPLASRRFLLSQSLPRARRVGPPGSQLTYLAGRRTYVTCEAGLTPVHRHSSGVSRCAHQTDHICIACRAVASINYRGMSNRKKLHTYEL